MTAFSMRAVGYRRVSMREQVDGFSLDAQENNIRKYASERDWKLVHLYTDAGISAKKDSQRPDLIRLMQDAKDGQFDVVIVDKIDRFYRHLSGLLNALDQLNNYKVTFVSVQERLDFTTPWGKLTLTMLGMLAEIYIDNLRQETRKGKLQRARDGMWNGNIPLGYCRGLCSRCDDPNGPGYCPDVGKPDKSDGKILVPHPIDSKAVQLAFDLYLNDTPNDVVIAEQLNQTTFIGPNGKEQPYRQRSIRGRKEPGPFTKDFVRGILNQIFYTGKIPYFGSTKPRRLQALYPGKHPAIISEDVFQETQEIRKSIAGIALMRGNTPQRIYPLTSRIFCGYCGYPLRGSTHNPNNTHVYKCSGRIERRDMCSQPSPKAIPLEKQVASLLKKAIQAWEKSVKPGKVALDVEEAEAQLQRAQELYIRGEVTKEVVEREKERVENLVQPLQELNFTATLPLVKKLQPALANWSKVTTIEQKRLLRSALEAIFVRETAIVALQPTFAFLPVLKALQEESGKSGPDGI
jgi:DNA invertase Pin-like site-specific DNA recombinase